MQVSVLPAVNGLHGNDLPHLAHILFGVFRHTALAGTAGTAAAASASGFLRGNIPDGADMLQKFELPPDIRIRCLQFSRKLFDCPGVPVL